ncbi:MAG: beta-L-arabinofuranosidase domain-containing protein [Pirellulales bacterium]
MKASCRLLSVALSLCIGAAAVAESGVSVVRELPGNTPASPSGGYVFNRAPLAPSPLAKLPVGSITPRGWLRQQLELDARGLVGRLPEISDFLKYEGNGWVDPKGTAGWEEIPYWLRGYGDLGYVLRDEKIIATARKWIDGILASQRADGYFGPARLKTSEGGLPDLWPHMLILDALHSWYEHSGDPRVIPFMLRYFRWQTSQPPAEFRKGWGAVRWADNMAVIYWLYNKTGEPWLLDLAKKIHENSVNYTTDIPTWHNVNLAQGIREPAEYWMQAKEPRFLEATELNYQKILGSWGQFAGGGFAGDENIRQPYRDPRQGLETCGFAEFMHTFELMTRISGNPLWSDRCEEIAFNSFPAALSPDHKGLHYITPANCIQLDKPGKQRGQFSNGAMPMLSYKPGVHEYRCCTHNYGMAWPYYAEELWLATADGGLLASLYAASEVKAKVGPDTEIAIAEETDYPFDETVTLRVATSKPVKFPLYLRVPRWCEGFSVAVNGQPVKTQAAPLSYVRIDRTWNDGDTVTVRLPMHVAVRTWTKNKDSVSVDYGPLTFSLAIEEKWSRGGGSADWPEMEVFPTSPWNYGLVFDREKPAKSFEVTRRKVPAGTNPFTHEGASVRLVAQGRKIPAWQADADNVVGVLQPSPVRSNEPIEKITLIPMGAARLRITSFPTIGTEPNAHDWAAPAAGPKATASHIFGPDTLDALGDGLEPESSGDGGVPRFTWWDHRGTTEWVQYDFSPAATVSAAAVYWFDDTGKGGCRVPKSWKLSYRDGDAWKPVQNASPYGTARDQYNRVTFKPVATSALRLEVQLGEGVSGGILEWKVDRGTVK